jgi:hypothetical protein
MYDTRECREFAAAMSTLQKWLSPVARRATPAAWGKIKGQFWSLGNLAIVGQRAAAATGAEKRRAMKLRP